MIAWLWWWLPPALRESVIVNLQSDPETAIRGILWQSRGPWLVLARAELLKPGMTPAAIDGRVIVHRSNVAFVQVLAASQGD